MYAVLLSVVLSATPVAPPVMPPDAPPVSTSCPCGIEGCECPAGDCDCGASLFVAPSSDQPATKVPGYEDYDPQDSDRTPEQIRACEKIAKAVQNGWPNHLSLETRGAHARHDLERWVMGEPEPKGLPATTDPLVAKAVAKHKRVFGAEPWKVSHDHWTDAWIYGRLIAAERQFSRDTTQAKNCGRADCTCHGGRCWCGTFCRCTSGNCRCEIDGLEVYVLGYKPLTSPVPGPGTAWESPTGGKLVLAPCPGQEWPEGWPGPFGQGKAEPYGPQPLTSGQEATVSKGTAAQEGRILYLLTQPGCPPCPGAKANALASGVPVQILDITSNMAFAESLWAGCSSELSTPSWVLTVDGKPVKHWKGQSNPTGVKRMLAFDATPLPGAPAGVVVTSQTASAGFTQPDDDAHRHQCGRCGTMWAHGGSIPGPVSHRCPNCGTQQTVIHSWVNRQPKAPLRSAVQYASRGCPNGCGR